MRCWVRFIFNYFNNFTILFYHAIVCIEQCNLFLRFVALFYLRDNWKLLHDRDRHLQEFSITSLHPDFEFHFSFEKFLLKKKESR